MGWLILAAGHSKRFYGDKLLSRFPHTGKTLLEHCLKEYADHGAPILVVTRPDHTTLHNLLMEMKIAFTVCPVSHLGMGSSLAWGVSKIEKYWPWAGIALADMALIQRETLCDLEHKITTANIVVPRLIKAPNDSCWGHPVLFGKSYFKYLRELKGDQGARQVLRRYKQYIVEVATEDSGTILDIDSRVDMEALTPLFTSSNIQV